MKRSIISTLAMSTLAAATLALSGCGVGMNSQTAEMVAPVAGVSLDTPGKDGQGQLQVRNAALVYSGPQGFKAGAEATARAWFFNMTANDQVVVVRYQGQEIKRATVKPGGYERAEMKLKLNQDVSNAQWVPVTIEWVDLKPVEIQLPVAPPEAPQPGEKVELPAEPGAEEH